MDSPALSVSSSSSSDDIPMEVPSTPLEEIENYNRMSSSVRTNVPFNSFTDKAETADAFFQGAFTTFSSCDEIDSLNKNALKLADLINTHLSAFATNFCKFADLLKYMLGWTNYCLTDPGVSESLDEALSNLFLKFIKVNFVNSLAHLFFSFFTTMHLFL